MLRYTSYAYVGAEVRTGSVRLLHWCGDHTGAYLSASPADSTGHSALSGVYPALCGDGIYHCSDFPYGFAGGNVVLVSCWSK